MEKLFHCSSLVGELLTNLVRIIKETGVEMELEENIPLLEWLANNYKNFGAGLEIITDR